MPYRIVPCRFNDGERYCILVDAQTRRPFWHPNLYITTQVRNASKSLSTMDSRLRAIKVLLDFCDERSIDLEDLVRSGQLFSLPQIDALRDFCQRNFDTENEKQVSRRIPGNVLSFPAPAPAPARVSKTYEYQRLTYIADYLGWYAGALHEGRLSPTAAKGVDNMVNLIRARRPPLRLSGRRRDKALQDSQFDLLMEIIQPGHPENPFKAQDIAVRNALIICLLAHLGIRRGELLGIRIPDIQIRELTLTVHRRPDEVADPRLRQPNTKTLARTLPLSPKLAEIIIEYILGVRKYIREAKKHNYLVVVHAPGPHRGKPLSTSGLGKIFADLRRAKPELSGLHPHALRHTWNWNISKALDQVPKDQRISRAEEEQVRNHVMGWQPGSGSAEGYNRRHIEQKAREAALLLQHQMYNKGGELDE